MGRPSKFTQAIVDEICDRLSNGETLRSICREDHMPHWNTVYDWAAADATIAGRIARARDLGADAIAEGTVEIIDQQPERDQNGKIDPGWVAHQKLRAEHRLKLLAKWNPKKYGDKMQLSGDAENPIAIQKIERVIVDK
jgi:hypothetical protein